VHDLVKRTTQNEVTAMDTSAQPESSDRLEEWIASLASPDPVVREQSREALVALGNCCVVRSLVGELNDPRQHVRWEAAKALAAIADPISAPALVDALDDEDDEVRWIAAEGLVAMGHEGLLTVLNGLVKRARSINFCHGAHHALSHFCKIKIPIKRIDRSAVAPVVAALEKTEPAVTAPAAALKALTQLRIGA
jgi:HEAT repeat protein